MRQFAILFILLFALQIAVKTQKYSDYFPEKGEYGFVQVGRSSESKMFYWFFESRSAPEKDPLLVWLQGGPGCSSLIGLFFEQGPFYIKNKGDEKATLRKIAWNQKANIIYVEQPLGVGFSEAHQSDQPQNSEDVQNQFQSFIVNWLNLPQFIKFKGRALYITGESYGGHWVPYISKKLYMNDNPDVNFKGCAIGNGWINSEKIYYNYPEFAAQHSEKTEFSQEDFQKLFPTAELCQHMIPKNNPMVTYNRMEVCNTVYDTILVNPKTEKVKFNVYNIDLKTSYPDHFSSFINKPGVQKVLGVNKK